MPPKQRKGYEIVQQGIKVLYTGEKPDIDIVAVPGLGANPEESWKSADSKNNFNWLSDRDGLRRDFPKARVLLYLYESAWSGPLKVKQFLGNIASTLLHGLSSARGDCPRRPIVFIGHSMGGLVVAKAVVTAEQRRDSFPLMFEAITGCLFFGTPFGGTRAAAAAAMLAEIGAKIDLASSSKLLDLMTPDNEGLNELRNDFVRLVGKLTPKIELFTFYEEQPTDFAKLAGLPALFGLWKLAIPSDIAEFVNRDSATLTGIDRMGLACIHRDLVKFDGFKDSRYQLVRDPLKKITHSAQLIAKNRLSSTRDVDRALIKGVLEALDVVPSQVKRRFLAKNISPSSWITKEDEYVGWLGKILVPETPREDCLWIRGPEGRGKTSACLAVIDDVETKIRADEEAGNDGATPLLAYVFCDALTEYSTAEELLRSLLRQLIDQQESLATYARQFIKKKGQAAPRATFSVENLWQSLQDMLAEDFIDVTIVVNNLHALPEESDSTNKLLGFIRAELQEMNGEARKRARVRWLFSSRENHGIEEALTVGNSRLIDLEDPRYGNQVQAELRKHAQQRVAMLGTQKKYNKALSYFATSLIGKRAQNTQWIDITCIHLAELPPAESDLRVRRVLEAVPQDLKALLDRAWLSIFGSCQEDPLERIKEILRALVLTYEDPTEAELALLAGLPGDLEQQHELRASLETCKPLLTLTKSGKGGRKISFMNVVVKTHLLANAKQILDLSKEETKWEHGVLALRCFSHLLERFTVPPEAAKVEEEESEKKEGDREVEVEAGNKPEESTAEAGETAEAAASESVKEGKDAEKADGDEQHSESQAAGGDQMVLAEDAETADDAATEATGDGDGVAEAGEGDGDEVEAEDDDEDDEDDEDADDEDESDEDEFDDEETDSDGDTAEEGADAEAWPELEDQTALDYAVKHWLHHASNATQEIAEDLSMEEDFWKADSSMRQHWLVEYQRLTSAFDGLNTQSLTGLHVAASVGFASLVTCLMRNGHDEDKNKRDVLANIPLHLAAYFGRPNTVEVLLNRDSPIDDGVAEGQATPLNMATYGGRVQIMKKLLRRGADANAVEKRSGPIISAAIRSGNREAIELLVAHGVSLAVEEKLAPHAPLALSALLSDLGTFEYLIGSCADRLTPTEYARALVTAAEAGRADVLQLLLQHKYDTATYQLAVDSAQEEMQWSIIPLLLKSCKGVECEDLFSSAATATGDQDFVLDAIWEHTDGAVSQETRNNALYAATDNEKKSTVKLLLEFYSADPNSTGDEYGNALTAAAFDGTLDIVRLLLDSGADISSPDGWAIQAAAGQGHTEVVAELIARGADVNAFKANERFTQGTALQAACEAGWVAIVKLLLEHKADPDMGAGVLKYPLIAAARTGEAEIMQMLLKAGAKTEVFGGPDLSSPLINASFTMPISSLEQLIDAGADPNLPDNDGDTAIIAAAVRGDEECLSFFLNKGVDAIHSSKRNLNALETALLAVMSGGEITCVKILASRYSTIIRSLQRQAKEPGNEAVAEALKKATLEKDTGWLVNPMPENMFETAGDEISALLTASGAGEEAKDVSLITADDSKAVRDAKLVSAAIVQAESKRPSLEANGAASLAISSPEQAHTTEEVPASEDPQPAPAPAEEAHVSEPHQLPSPPLDVTTNSDPRTQTFTVPIPNSVPLEAPQLDIYRPQIEPPAPPAPTTHELPLRSFPNVADTPTDVVYPPPIAPTYLSNPSRNASGPAQQQQHQYPSYPSPDPSPAYIGGGPAPDPFPPSAFAQPQPPPPPPQQQHTASLYDGSGYYEPGAYPGHYDSSVKQQQQQQQQQQSGWQGQQGGRYGAGWQGGGGQPEQQQGQMPGGYYGQFGGGGAGSGPQWSGR